MFEHQHDREIFSQADHGRVAEVASVFAEPGTKAGDNAWLIEPYERQHEPIFHKFNPVLRTLKTNPEFSAIILNDQDSIITVKYTVRWLGD
jgi:hypothetical protein